MTAANEIKAVPSAHNGRNAMWKVTDPARVRAGLYGITFHATRKQAETRVAMFPGSVMEFVGNVSSGNSGE